MRPSVRTLNLGCAIVTCISLCGCSPSGPDLPEGYERYTPFDYRKKNREGSTIGSIEVDANGKVVREILYNRDGSTILGTIELDGNGNVIKRTGDNRKIAAPAPTNLGNGSGEPRASSEVRTHPQHESDVEVLNNELRKAQEEWESGNPNWAEDY